MLTPARLLHLSISVFLLVIVNFTYAQQPVQTIRGIVNDNFSNAPIAFANVIVLNSSPVIGAITDSLGNFVLQDVPVGRHDIRVSFTGYEPLIVREVEVVSAKEAFLQIQLKESYTTLEGVTIRPGVSKEQPLNSMATVSARMLSVDEAKRFAGGFDDPARLASSFAGVSSNVGDNGIVVRGNAPKFLQWRMEGVEIPNPNHFADLNAFGGGALTALSTQMLANSDFFTGAFPAEYGNALSGVFDIFMRNGNNEKHEHTFQAGVIGIDVSSEGPFKKGGKASYLFNYRYATLGLVAPLLPEDAGLIKYQDLSFKLNFPTKKAGTFSLWGIGLIDRSGQKAKTDSLEWTYNSSKEEQDVKQYMGAGGLSHKYFFNNKTFIKTILAASASGLDLFTESLNDQFVFVPRNSIKNNNTNVVLNSYVNTRLNTRHTNRTGVILTGLLYDLRFQNSLNAGDPLQTISNESGYSSLLSAYSNSSYLLSDNIILNMGVHGQLFTLNNHYTVEPRLGLKWRFSPKQSIGLGYGLHSRLERLNYYFTTNSAGELINKNLDFTKSHHFVLSYDRNIGENMHLKIEPYYQHLFSVPVIADSSFSFINFINDWFFNEQLENTGKGRNYGIDLTFERYLSKGYYFLLSTSLFNSEYMGGDGVWRNTRFNRNYLFNFLTGKEWQFGKNKQKIFGVNVRATYQGGDRYSPINQTASLAVQNTVFNESMAFSQQFPAAFTTHLTVNYKVNREKTTREIAFKLLNATMYQEFASFQYNLITHTIDERRNAIFIPNLSYKIEF
jgi:hypothetical protein